MKEHFCPAEKSMITYQGECSWCGESEGSMNEILEMAREAGGSDVGGPGWTTWVGTQSTEFLERFARLVAAKTLAQAEQCNYPDCKCPTENPCLKGLAQPEQEPVAWVSEDVCKGQYIDGRPRKIWWECEKGVGTAFYTTPPQRTWVGLTDEDKKQMAKEANYHWEMTTGEYAELIGHLTEAKLKEKNK